MNCEVLYLLRTKDNYNQENIANVLGISRSRYTKYESGNDLIPLKHLNTLANFYNVSIDYLIGAIKVRNSSKNPIINLDKVVIGKRLREFRKKLNITQVELASFLNTTHSNISSYETGKTTILTAFAIQLTNKYNISLDWLVGKSDIMFINELIEI